MNTVCKFIRATERGFEVYCIESDTSLVEISAALLKYYSTEAQVASLLNGIPTVYTTLKDAHEDACAEFTYYWRQGKWVCGRARDYDSRLKLYLGAPRYREVSRESILQEDPTIVAFLDDKTTPQPTPS